MVPKICSSPLTILWIPPNPFLAGMSRLSRCQSISGSNWMNFYYPQLSAKDTDAQTLAQWLARPESEHFKT